LLLSRSFAFCSALCLNTVMARAISPISSHRCAPATVMAVLAFASSRSAPITRVKGAEIPLGTATRKTTTPLAVARMKSAIVIRTA
jgi:hypothetical protein